MSYNKNVSPVRVAIIGCGKKARDHAREILKRENTEIVVVCEPEPAAYEAMANIFSEASLPAPPNLPHLDQILQDYSDDLDVAVIVTPHPEMARIALTVTRPVENNPRQPTLADVIAVYEAAFAGID